MENLREKVFQLGEFLAINAYGKYLPGMLLLGPADKMNKLVSELALNVSWVDGSKLVEIKIHDGGKFCKSKQFAMIRGTFFKTKKGANAFKFEGESHTLINLSGNTFLHKEFDPLENNASYFKEAMSNGNHRSFWIAVETPVFESWLAQQEVIKERINHVS